MFIRELLSNCSDALEKQKFRELKGESTSADGEDLKIEVQTNEKERTITFFDSGIGMNKDEAIEHLGTIAKSGSKAKVPPKILLRLIFAKVAPVIVALVVPKAWTLT